MSDIAKSIELYELIIKRLRKSGNAPNQLAAYEGSLECIKECKTLEESMDKLAASPWYTAVAQGLVLDALEAKRKAALEQDMDDVVAAYDAKIEEVKTDYFKAWDTSYVANIQDMFNAHVNAKEKEVQDYIDSIIASIKEQEDFKPDVEEQWKQLKEHQAEVVEIGKKELAKLTRASATCTAPADRSGKYSFECTEKEAY